jgi:hypothetical protein
MFQRAVGRLIVQVGDFLSTLNQVLWLLGFTTQRVVGSDPIDDHRTTPSRIHTSPTRGAHIKEAMA